MNIRPVVKMDRKELADEVERLREWIIDIGKITPHPWLKKDVVRVLENDYDAGN